MIPIVGGPLHGEHVFLINKRFVVLHGVLKASQAQELDDQEYKFILADWNIAYFRHVSLDPTVAELARLSIT